MTADLRVVPDTTALAEGAAERFVAAAADAVEVRGRFVVALSGGSTPQGLYRRLATEHFASRVEWSRVQILWGDERCVPPDQKESNYRMAREALLDQVPVPAANVHRIRGEDDPVAAAGHYEAALRVLFQLPVGPAGARPGASIDLILLGLGGDGHTASLFPGSAAVRERTRWVAAERAAAASLWRVTLTPAVINAALEVLFLVSGSAKARILRRVLEGPRHPAELPAQAVLPVHGRVHWLVDAAAAAGLDQGARGSSS